MVQGETVLPRIAAPEAWNPLRSARRAAWRPPGARALSTSASGASVAGEFRLVGWHELPCAGQGVRSGHTQWAPASAGACWCSLHEDEAGTRYGASRAEEPASAWMTTPAFAWWEAALPCNAGHDACSRSRARTREACQSQLSPLGARSQLDSPSSPLLLRSAS